MIRPEHRKQAVQQFAHDGNHSLQASLATIDQTLMIRLGFGSPTLSNLSRQACECRLYGLGFSTASERKGGGPVFTSGCGLLRLKRISGLPPKPNPLFHYHQQRGSGRYQKDTKQLTFHGRIFITWGFPFFAEFMPTVQTDGRRIYFISSADRGLYSVAVNGGEVTTVRRVPLRVTFLLHISPDGATLLAKEGLGRQGNTESTLWLLATNGGSARPLGDVQAHDAAWFPDGNRIAFASGNALYVTDDGGGSSRKLFDTPGRAFWIRWAPDGKRLRFTVVDPTTQARSIWEATLAGQLRRFLPDWKGAGDVCCGEWTKDGRDFVFRNTRDNRTEYLNVKLP